MSTDTFLISSIREITKDRLVFSNKENQLQEINLNECRRNWVEHFNNNGFATFEGTPAPKISPEENLCIGERDWFSEKPYYVFYSNPKIRFEIHPKKRLLDHLNKYWYQRYYSEFRKVENQLQEVGLCTFDLG
ncbi:MAG TPA: hypothetical protein GXZ67_03865 [Clostridiaceae bacterium]|jgi:hypothetical protein|nr:hypothetical protein [Clostridiaceae bacterium]